MSLTVFQSYNNIGDGLVAFSALKAGGFDPVFQNVHHAYAASLHMLALGGLIILLPEAQHDEAGEYIATLPDVASKDYDPIQTRSYGQWIKGTVFGTAVFGVFPLPLYWLPPLWLGLMGVILIFIDSLIAKSLGVSFMVMSVLTWHAKHIAIPRLRKSYEH